MVRVDFESTFFLCLDIINVQLEKRFRSVNEIVDNFKIIHPQELLKYTDDEVQKESLKLIEKYRNDLTDQFPVQILSLRSCLKSERVSCIPLKS